MTAVATTKKPKRRPRYVWMRWQPVARLDTGEEVLALVAAADMDRAELRRRKHKPGEIVRAELRLRRDPTNWRRMHALAKAVAQNVDGFEELAAAEDWHGVVKRLQAESGVACEPMELDLGALGKHSVSVPQSLAFDGMDESEFKRVHRGLSMHITKHYFPDMGEAAKEEMQKMLARPEDSES